VNLVGDDGFSVLNPVVEMVHMFRYVPLDSGGNGLTSSRFGR
jgi:hypothetical protein